MAPPAQSGRSAKEGEPHTVLNQPITALDFGPSTFRIVKALQDQGGQLLLPPDEPIIYIGQLVQQTENELLRRPQFGRRTLNAVKTALASLGLKLGMSVPWWQAPF